MKTGFVSLHPVTGMLFYAVCFAVSLTATHPVILFGTFFSAFLYLVKLQGKSALRYLLKIVLPVILISALINGFFNHQGNITLFTLPTGSPFTLEAVLYGLVLAIRAGSVLLWLGSFNEIVSGDRVTYIFGRLSPKTALLISVALRFIPLVFSQSEEIERAARATGSSGDGKSFRERLFLASKRLSILVSWTLERGIDTMNSMKARGYGLRGSTLYSPYRFSFRDAGFIVLYAVGSCCLLALNSRIAAEYIPSLMIPLPHTADYLLSAAALFFMLSPLIFDIYEERKWSISV